jgi:hypothetical protein
MRLGRVHVIVLLVYDSNRSGTCFVALAFLDVDVLVSVFIQSEKC